ncbi:MAG: hypothetical protein H6838_09510 [Planctomycetes bacterium]|nr:hypothetical protein [Planctomycetota bacterium]
MPRICLLLVACLLPVATAAAQDLRAALQALRNGALGEPEFDRALPLLPQMLTSDSSTTVAGAAYLVGKHRRTECAPDLLRALADHDAGDRPIEAVQRALLDALIQLDFAAPGEILLRRPQRQLADHLYLALACEKQPRRRADNMFGLVSLGWIETRAHWAAACRLTAAADPRIAAWLVKGTDIELCCVVHDVDSEPGFFGMGSGGGWSSSGSHWPPITNYELRLPGADQPLDDVGSKRTEHSRSGPSPEKVCVDERIEWRGRLLTHLVGQVAAAEVEALLAPMQVAFADNDSLTAAINAQVAARRARLRTVAMLLARRKLLEEPLSGLDKVRFVVEFVDHRSGEDKPALPRDSGDPAVILRDR